MARPRPRRRRRRLRRAGAVARHRRPRRADGGARARRHALADGAAAPRARRGRAPDRRRGRGVRGAEGAPLDGDRRARGGHGVGGGDGMGARAGRAGGGRPRGVGRRREQYSDGARGRGGRGRARAAPAGPHRGPHPADVGQRAPRAARRHRGGAEERGRRPGDAGEGSVPPGGAQVKPILVTGGTGFVGANVVRELVARGAGSVRVLARRGGDRRALDGVPVEIVEGDLLDRASLARAVTGADTLYHVAADYRLWARDPTELHRVNVDGTRAILEAAGEAGVRRIVYTSTVGALGLPTDGTPGPLADMVGPYKASKFLAERVAMDLAARGLPVVIVNPSAPIGPWDVKPTPTGQMIVDFMRGRMFATLDTGLNIVHVRDVARGHVLAAERGRVGERYILGHLRGNLSLAEIGRLLAEATGRSAPRLRVPYALAWCGAACTEAVARLTGRPPAVPLTAVRMARKRMYFSPTKAVRELGLPQTDPREALHDAVRWFAAHGYARVAAGAQVAAR